VKRRAIIVVTFLAGLYYLLEFVLPPRIGGAPDADGAAAATSAQIGATRFIAYTGLRNDGRPVIMRVRGDGAGPRQVLIAPGFSRRDDYRGARAPQFVAPDRLYYIGLGWDDRTPRVCLARHAAGRWRALSRAVLGNGLPGEPDSSGIAWASISRETTGGYRMLYLGLQGERATLCMALSPDGLQWTKRGPVAAEDINGLRPLSVTQTGADARSPVLLLLRDAAGRRILREVVLVDGVRRLRKLADVGLPQGLTLQDIRHSSPMSFLATTEEANGVTSVAALTWSTRMNALALEVTNPTLIAPGKKPTSTYLSDARGTVDDLLVVVGAFAVGLGLIGLAQLHGRRLLALQKGWPESTAFFLAAGAMASFTVYARLHPDAGTWGTRGYDLLFYGLLQPLGSSMFSLLAAYLVSAAYRAFRVRTFEGGLLAASATLIMLGQVPVGNWLTQHLPPYLQIPKVMAWVLFVNNTAVVRAVNFGIFVGALATAMRVWLSMDRASMRSVE